MAKRGRPRSSKVRRGRQQAQQAERGPLQGRRRRRARQDEPLATPLTSNRPVVTIRAQDGEVFATDVMSGAGFERLAQEWAYTLRARPRWVDDQPVRQDFRDRALDDLERAGIPRAFMRRLASVRHVEVELHEWDPKDAEASRLHEAASEVPWEYLISAGTRGEGRFQSILI